MDIMRTVYACESGCGEFNKQQAERHRHEYDHLLEKRIIGMGKLPEHNMFSTDDVNAQRSKVHEIFIKKPAKRRAKHVYRDLLRQEIQETRQSYETIGETFNAFRRLLGVPEKDYSWLKY